MFRCMICHWEMGKTWKILGSLLLFSLISDIQAEELRYQWKQGQQFAYNIEITVDTGQSVTTFKGTTRYTVDSVADGQMRVTYVGGLPESSKAKEQARRPSGPPFGPPGFGGPPRFGPPGFPNPFGRATFAGKFSTTTNKITLSSRGVALAMEGDSQLPYLLGNVSLMPFETLPQKKDNQWTIDAGISITESDDDRRHPFGPFGPFGRSGDKTVQAGTEKTSFTIQKETPQQLVTAKTYQLSTPKTADQPAFDINGTGTWTFDKQQNISKSLDFKQKLVVHEDNTDVTFPTTIKYNLLTAADIAKLDEDAKRQREEHERKIAEAKQQAEAPLSAEEKRKSLTALASNDPTQILATLKQLSGKKPNDPDPEIVASLHGLLAHRNKQIQDDAQKTLMNWSPDYKRVIDINNEYKAQAPVKSTDRSPTESNPLYIGQIVQAHLNSAFWYAAEVLDLLPDGKVMVRTRGFGAREHTVARRDIQLAPDEVEQPARPSASTTAAARNTATAGATTASVHTWNDSTGQHKIEATFLGIEQGKVKMRRTDGKELSVPLERLSKADQVYAEQQQAKKSDNPFQ
jgi:hypothetical protein